MAPFGMKCTTCGEYIYKGRKFNARKETTDEKYYNIPVYRFYIRCTRCSAELTFKTDPKNMDYECEKGAKRNFEPWREAKLAEETEEERLDRMEREEAERDAMAELETKALDARTEMAIADSLDAIRTRNARLERSGASAGVDVGLEKAQTERDEARKRQEEEDEEAARMAFRGGTGESVRRVVEEEEGEDDGEQKKVEELSFARLKKKKKDFSAALGIKTASPSVSAAPVAASPATAPAITTASPVTAAAPAAGGGIGLGLGGYNSDDD